MKVNRRLFVFVAPAILCVIATCQRYVCFTNDLTVWKGGGFAMFSAPVGQREITVSFESDDGRETRIKGRRLYRMNIDREIKKRIEKTVVMPSQRSLALLAEGLHSTKWTLVPRKDERFKTNPDEPGLVPVAGEVPEGTEDGDEISVKSMCVEIWEYRFRSKKKKQLRLTQIASYDIAVSSIE